MIEPVHEIHIPMRWADLDLLGHVNNVVYVRWMQDVAAAHWEAAAPAALREARGSCVSTKS